MDSLSFWLDDRHTPRRPLKGEETCSIVIIGGGIVGIAAAYFLAQRNCRVILLERGLIGGAASGRNAGFILSGTHQHYSKAQEAYGRDKTRTLWRLSLDNHRLMRDLIEREHLSCDYGRHGSHRLADSEEEFEVLCQSAKKLNQDGFHADILMPAELKRLLPGSSFSGGLLSPDDGEIHPVKYVRGLAVAAERAGARLYEQTPVTSIEGTTLTTERGQVQTDMILFSTNAYSPMLHPFFEEIVVPMRGQCCVTEPFQQRVIPAPAYANWGMDYFRQLPDGRFLMGGGRHTSIQTEYTYSEQTTEAIQSYIEKALHKHFPATRNLRVTHRWAGTMGFSCDDLPTVGPIPGTVHTYAAVGYHGHGFSFGTVCAKMVTEMMLDGRTEFPASIFSPHRHTL